MTDKFTPAERSRIMGRVRGRDTKPERAVRSLLFAHGLRFRLHRRDLPGAPDIVLPKHRTAVFVHGCFWHGHDCRRGRRPESNTAFWDAKIDRNIARDQAAVRNLEALGWRVETIWGCCLKEGVEEVVRRIQARAADGVISFVRCEE